jgi:two-component system, OmpR family, response regulator
VSRRIARVLVVEDDFAIRSTLELALKGQDYEVETAADGTAISRIVGAFRPDLAILDVGLPEGPDGYHIARFLRQDSDMPLLFLTAADELDSRLAGFEAGADDYMVKPFSMAELLARVKALLRRSGRLANPVWQVEDLIMDESAHTVVRGGVPLELTHIEYQLLCALFQQPGRVLSKAQLLTAVWQFGDFDPNLVEVHISALRRKLEAQGPRLVHTVRGAGYVLRP